MARNHNGQMALYEVLNKERFSAAQKKELARVTQAKTERAQPVIIPPQQSKAADVKQTVWTKKPSMFGFNSGRVEAYVPYPIAVTAVMALALLLVICFKIGNVVGNRDVRIAKTTEKSSEIVNLADTAKAAKEMARLAAMPAKHGTAAVTLAATATERTSGEPAKTGDAKGGEYVIVLAELKNAQSAKDFEPAKQYFDEHGISTEIKSFRGSYFLVTTERYDSVARGTPGATLIEKIGQIGTKYKAPSGYGGFGPKPFSDAYGRKM